MTDDEKNRQAGLTPGSNGSGSPAAGMVVFLGVLIMLAGIISTLYFCFGFDTGISTFNGDVSNLGLLEDRLVGVLSSLATALGGLLIILFTATRRK